MVDVIEIIQSGGLPALLLLFIAAAWRALKNGDVVLGTEHRAWVQRCERLEEESRETIVLARRLADLLEQRGSGPSSGGG